MNQRNFGAKEYNVQGRSVTGSRIIAGAIALYLVIVVGAFLKFNLAITPDRMIILLLIAALGTGRVRQFFKDWSIFLVVILAWQFLSGVSGNISHLKPHVTEMIAADRLLFFGSVPTIWLQHHFYHPGRVAWYDALATVLYLLHFVFPMAVAFALWWWKRSVFLEFMVAFLVLGLAGFATYVLFPAAPPWIAANWWHYFPHVYRIAHRPEMRFLGHQSVSTLFNWFWSHGGWDQFGAVPSEHAAFPFLCFLYAQLAWRRAGWTLLLYCVAVWVAVVYLGEHYAIDVIVGVVYASASFALVRFLMGRRAQGTQGATARANRGSLSDSLTA